LLQKQLSLGHLQHHATSKLGEKSQVLLTRPILIGFAYSFLDSLDEIDGFILKRRSPTSAIRDARIYPSIENKVAPILKGPGFFAATVIERFPHLAVEDEGRLRNHE